MVGEPQLAEAVVENAFAALANTDGQLAAGGTSARTRILTLVHRRAVELARGTERPPGTRPALDGDTHDQADGRLGVERARSQRALAQLPERQRELLVLAYHDGLGAAEIAARLGQPVETVEDSLRAGLVQLRDALAEVAMPREALVWKEPSPATEPRRRRRWASLAPETERAVEDAILDGNLDRV